MSLGWPGSSLYSGSSKYFDLCCADLVQDYICTYAQTPKATPENDTHIPLSSTSENKYFKKSFSHYWITSYRKCRMCVPIGCDGVLIFQLGGESCRQLNHKQSTAATNQLWRKGTFFLFYLKHNRTYDVGNSSTAQIERKNFSWNAVERSTKEVNRLQRLVLSFSSTSKNLSVAQELLTWEPSRTLKTEM